MTIRLHDNQGRDWTIEGDWSAQVVGADFDGAGQILMWIRPDNPDAHLDPLVPDPAAAAIEQMIATPPRELPAPKED